MLERIESLFIIEYIKINLNENMRLLWIMFIVFGLAVVIFDKFLVYLIWWFFVFVGVNFLYMAKKFPGNKWEPDNYVKFGKYKIFR